MSAALVLERFDIAWLRAENPGPLTLGGTNTWVVGRDPCVVIDPGPALPEHIEAVAAEVRARGGAQAIALTHDHRDHTEAVEPLSVRIGGPPACRTGAAGPLRAVPTPGHSPESVTWLWGEDVAFTGDAVLGEGSVFVSAQLAVYLEALRDLRRRPLQLICPGHGPLVENPAAKLDDYLAHRLERERRVLGALAGGARSVDELLDEAWSDAPVFLRPAAAMSLGAHLEKLADEGRLPGGVARPDAVSLDR